MRLDTCCDQHRIFDARAVAKIMQRRDPTGTAPIRKRFSTEIARRLSSLKTAARQVIVEKNHVGLGRTGDNINLGQAPHEKLGAFDTWFSNAVDTIVVSYDPSWVEHYVRQGYDKGASDASRYMRVVNVSVPVDDSVAALASIAAIELRGIGEELKRQALQRVSRIIVTGGSARDAYQAVGDRVRKIGRARASALVNTAIVAAHARGSLDVYAATGVDRVGIKPEYVPKVRIGDRDTTSSPWLEPWRRAARRRRGLGTTVAILTAGDEDVCADCWDLEEGSPYTLDEASALIPFHPNCRCSLVPWDEDVEELIEGDALVDYNPMQPRDPKGTPTGGQWTKGAPSIHSNLTIKPDGQLHQPFSTLDEIYRVARDDEPAFTAMVDYLATMAGGQSKFTPPHHAEPGTILKTRESAQRKADTELDGDVTRLTDVLRGTVLMDSVRATREAAVRFIVQQGPNIVEVKDKYVDPSDDRYRDLNVKFKMPSGLIAELQFNSRHMLHAKINEGHLLYEQMRAIQKDPIKLSVMMELRARSKALYEHAYKLDGNGNWGRG